MLTTPPKTTPSDSSRQIGYGDSRRVRFQWIPAWSQFSSRNIHQGRGESLDFFVSHVQVSREIRYGAKLLVPLKLPHTARRLACHIFHQ